MWAVLLRWARPAAEQISGGQMTWAAEGDLVEQTEKAAGSCVAGDRFVARAHWCARLNKTLPNGSWRIVLTPNEFLRQGQVTRAADAHLGTRTRSRLGLLPMVFAPDRLADWWLALAPLGHSGADELGRYVEDPETGSAFEAPARRVPDRLPAPRTPAAHTRRAALSHELLFAEAAIVKVHGTLLTQAPYLACEAGGHRFG